MSTRRRSARLNSATGCARPAGTWDADTPANCNAVSTGWAATARIEKATPVSNAEGTSAPQGDGVKALRCGRGDGANYVTSQASCTVQWVVATAGAGGPIYSAYMRCSSLSTPEQKTELNRIIVPVDNDQPSAGADLKDLKSYQRCPAN